MVAPAVVLAMAGLGLWLVPSVEAAAHVAVERLHDGAGYAQAVLEGSALRWHGWSAAEVRAGRVGSTTILGCGRRQLRHRHLVPLRHVNGHAALVGVRAQLCR
jgi:hypothetical protein